MPRRASCAASASAGRSSAKIRAASGDDDDDDDDDEDNDDESADDDAAEEGDGVAMARWRGLAPRRCVDMEDEDAFDDALRRDAHTLSHSVATSAQYGCGGVAAATGDARNHDAKKDEGGGGGGESAGAVGDGGALLNE